MAAVVSLFAAEISAAMLGDIRVHSALGEKFDASISVASTDEEEINSNCFRLVSPHESDEQNVLRRAKLIFQQEGNGGRLLVHGLDALQEPVVNVAVRVKCPGEEDRVFQRDYSVLLDPREYKTPQIRKPIEAVVSSKLNKRSLPRLGTAWLSEEGDTVANIARRYYPNDEKQRAKFIEGIFDLNPDLPQGTSVRLGGDWRLQLPSPAAKPTAEAPPPVRVAPMTQLEAQPRLTLDPAPPATALTPSTSAESVGDFRLRLSLPSMDLTQKNNLTPEETLRLRERLLSLESDEQAAQMLQLKYQISQLEKQLGSLRGSVASPSSALSAQAESNSKNDTYSFSWKWFLLLALIAIAVALLFWRKRANQRRAQEEPYSMLGISTLHVGNPYGGAASHRPTTNFNSQFMPRTGGFDHDEVGIPVRNMDEQEWKNEDMDVVSPNSVAEEAQLLIDHGLTKQAINLLMHEVAERPTSLALWMKLFDVFQQNNMVDLFQERAVAFRLQFSSEALWQQVQGLGLQIDPMNPLYQSVDAMPDFSLFPDTDVETEEITDRNLAQALYDDVGLIVPETEDTTELVESEEFGFEIDFSPLQNETSFDDLPTDVAVLSIVEEYISEEEPDFVDSPPVLPTTLPAPEQTTRVPIDATDFASDDETLQEIAGLITEGQRREAFERLETLLYKGTMPQRLTASKWLDKLLSKYGKP